MNNFIHQRTIKRRVADVALLDSQGRRRRLLGPSAGVLAATLVALQFPVGAANGIVDGGQDMRSSLRGRVIEAATGAGVVRATVTIGEGGKGASRRVVETDADGRFRVDGLVRGVYQINVTHADHFPGGYGQLWLNGPLRVYRLRSGSSTAEVIIHLWKPATLEGTLTSRDGNGLPGVNVVAFSRDFDASSRVSSAPFTATTDQNGKYRFAGLPPGNYVVSTNFSYSTVCVSPALDSECFLTPRNNSPRPMVNEAGHPQVYDSVFYPNARQISDAETIRLHSGEQLNGIDFTASLVDTVEVRGAVESLRGPLANASVRLVRSGNVAINGLDLAIATTSTNRAGNFVLLGVPAGTHALLGEYRPVVVRGPTTVDGPHGRVERGSVSVLPVSDNDPLLVDQLEVNISSDDLTNCRLTLREAPSVKGQLHFQGESGIPDARTLASRSVILRPAASPVASVRAKLDTAGKFYFPSVPPDFYFLSIDNIPRWSVRSIEMNGVNGGKSPIDIRYRSTNFVKVQMGDSATSIEGAVVFQNGASNPDAVVFIFPNAALTASPIARPVDEAKMVPVGESGEFTVALSSGDYVAVAVEDAAWDVDWRQPEILQTLARQGTLIRLSDRQVGRVTLTSRRIAP